MRSGRLLRERTSSLPGFECLGACDIAPMASIDERYFGPLEAGDAATAIEQLEAGRTCCPRRRWRSGRWLEGPDA